MKAELELMDSAVRAVQQRDPAAPAAGTHIYVPWTAPYAVSVLPTLSPEDYYKLFVKNCFQGRNYGLPHEYGPTYKCRHCRFAIPQEMLYPAGSDASVNMKTKEREAYIALKLEEQKEAAIAAISEHVMINEETFRRLEDKIRQRRGITTKAPPVTPPFLTRLSELATNLEMAMPAARDTMALLLESLQRIAAEGLAEDIERRGAIAAFSARYDALLAAVDARMTALLPASQRVYVKPALEALGKITANPEGAVGARNIVQIFVVYGEQIADDYVNDNPYVTKWLPQVSRSHKEDVTAIWKRLALIASKRLDELRRFDAGVIAVVNKALRRYTSWMGTWLGIWINEFRPVGTEATPTELTLILRWLTLSGFEALLSTESPLYADAAVPDHKTIAVKFMNDWITDALTTAGQRVDEYQMTEAQVTEKLNIRAEKELALFIDKFERLPSDLRKIELLKKKLKLGDWSAGNMANMRKYNSDFYELKRDQLAQMRIPLFSSEITGLPEAAAGAAAAAAAQQQEGGSMHDNLHYADDGEGQYDS
jgi:hypothetical protein